MIDASEIDSAISAREAEIIRLRHELEIAEAELRGMKTARDQIFGVALHAPVTAKALVNITTQRGFSGAHATAAIDAEVRRYRGGRQPGAISFTWRHILSHLYWTFQRPGRGFRETHLIGAANAYGIAGLRQKDALDRIKQYSLHEYIEREANGDCYVTAFAARKFGFFEKMLENDEAPDAKAQEPHEFRHLAEETGAR